MPDEIYPRIQAACQQLRLTEVAHALDGVAETAAKEQWTYTAFLDQLLDREVSARRQRDMARKIRLAKFPYVKTLDQFEFAFQPTINERQVRELATLRFAAHGENVVLLGPPGVGKTQPRHDPAGVECSPN